MLVHTDDCVIFQQWGSINAEELIWMLQEGEEKFTLLTDDGNLEQYLGVDVKKKKDNKRN